MNKRSLLSLVVGSLLGAAIIHVTLVACSDPTRPAHAADCAAYEVAGYYEPALIQQSPGGDWTTGLSPSITLPAGWEPLSAQPYAGSSQAVGAMVMVRRCAP